jgi:hypothetical protein
MRDTYEADALGATEVIYIGHKLQAGDRIQSFMLYSDNLGGTATIDIGTLADDDEFASAIDISGQVVSGNVAMLVDGNDYVVGTTANDDIIMITVNTAAVTGTLKLVVLYTKS